MKCWVVVTLALLFGAAGSVHGEAQSSPLLGAWRVQPPGEATIFVVLRAENSASRFETGSNSPQIVNGHWTWSGERMEIVWNDGKRHRLQERETGFEMAVFAADASTPRYVTATERIPGDHLGNWAVAPSRPRSERTADEEIERGYQGNWEVAVSENTNAYFVVFPDRNAVSNWLPEASVFSNLRGIWARQGNELHITWENGWYTILRETDRSHALLTFGPATSLDEVEPTTLSARRVRDDLVPAGIPAFGSREENPISRIGLRFENRRQAQRFFRGSWLIRRPELDFERVRVSRFGGLTTTRRTDLRGDWRYGGQDLFFNWEDGVRQVVSPIGRGFVAFEYAPGRPIDGVPNRVFTSAPAESNQRALLSPDQREFAAALIADAAEAARIPFAERPTSALRSLSSALWPFGGENVSEFPEDTLVVSPSRRASDPWWWTFWSEPVVESDPAEPEDRSNGTDQGSDTPRPDVSRERAWTPVF